MANPAFADIGACVFDAYGTLFDVHSAVGRGGGALGDKAGPVSALWRQKQLEYTWLRSLMRAYADFWQLTGEGLDYALAANGIADPELRQRLMDLYLSLDAYPDVPDALDRLRAAGRKTAILSNGAPNMLQAAVETAGLGSRLDATPIGSGSRRRASASSPPTAGTPRGRPISASRSPGSTASASSPNACPARPRR
jgi:2-haloacid dehalogenase